MISILAADGDDVDGMVADLDEARWALPTPASGWTVAHQIAHLTATFRLAGLAAAHPERFIALSAELSPDFNANVAAAMREFLAETPPVLLRRWREERARTQEALAAVPAD